jgi:hypothetical protein
VALFLEEDNNMDTVNFGNMKKKKQGVTVAPKTGLAKTNVTDHSYTQGKSRVQGNQGVMQGNKGWQSQATDVGGYGKQINPIINSLSQAPTYETPKITDSLLTQDGFNQALGVVGARNNAKLKSQNQRVLQGVLGSLVSGDSQNRATANRANIAQLQDNTDRRGQDLTKETNANALAESANRNKTLGKYYEGQTGIGEERNKIAREGMQSNTKSLDANEKMQEAQRRARAEQYSTDDEFRALLDTEINSEIGSSNLTRAREMYIQTGNVPNFKKDNTPFGQNFFQATGEFFDDEYSPQYNAQQQPTAQPQQPQGQQKQEAFKLTTEQENNLLTKLATEYEFPLSALSIKDGWVTTPNGDYEISKLGK